MKILQIVTLGYENGGAESGIVSTRNILGMAGHDVRALSSDLPSPIPRFSEYTFAAIPSKGWRRFVYTAFNFAAYTKLRDVLKEFKPDVVLLHTMDQPTAAILFLLRKYPTIQLVHGPEVFTKELLVWHLDPKDFRDRTYKVKDLTLSGRLHYWYYLYVCGPLYRLGFRNVDTFVALSGYTKNMLRKQHIQATYIPNGVPLWSLVSQPKGDPVIFFAGRLESYKGVDDLIDAMTVIRRHVPGATLHIAGHGSYRNKLEEQVARLGLESSVIFMGRLTQQEMSRAYASASVFVMPSHWPETFGKVGVEAMSTGCPVVATDVGGVTDWLKDGKNGYLVTPKCPDQLAEKIVAILSDQKLNSAMRKYARSTAEEFSIEEMVANIFDLAQKLIDRKK